MPRQSERLKKRKREEDVNGDSNTGKDNETKVGVGSKTKTKTKTDSNEDGESSKTTKNRKKIKQKTMTTSSRKTKPESDDEDDNADIHENAAPTTPQDDHADQESITITGDTSLAPAEENAPSPSSEHDEPPTKNKSSTKSQTKKRPSSATEQKMVHWYMSYPRSQPDAPTDQTAHYKTPLFAPTTIITHGAGGGVRTPAMTTFTTGYSRQTSVLAFQGTMNLPARTDTFRRFVQLFPSVDTLGGRSMGARAAVIACAAHRSIKNLLLLSFPLTSNGKSREDILLNIPVGVNVLFVSGDRDSMCEIDALRDVIRRMKCKDTTSLVVVKGADHGMAYKGADARVSKKSVEMLLGRAVGAWAARWREKVVDGKMVEKGEFEMGWKSDMKVFTKRVKD